MTTKDKSPNNEEQDNEEQEIEENKEEAKDKKLLTEENDGELIDNLTEKIKSLEDKLLRSIAESENIRSRMSKTIEETREYSITSFAKDLVPVIDNLSRALEHLPKEMDDLTKNIVEGIKMTKQELESVFKKYGLEAIKPAAGDDFDYNMHHAISQLQSDEHKEGSVINLMQVGYKIKDRLIRPASVVVAKK